VQVGLTKGEIAQINRQIDRLLKLIDKGKIQTY